METNSTPVSLLGYIAYLSVSTRPIQSSSRKSRISSDKKDRWLLIEILADTYQPETIAEQRKSMFKLIP
jgi:hypothetical protein